MSLPIQCASCGGFCGKGHCKTVNLPPKSDAIAEALSALYGCREVLGDLANISLAIEKLEKIK